MSKILVDTNVMVYAIDSTDEEKNLKALEWMGKILEEGKGSSYCISLQNIREFCSICVKKKIPHEKVFEWVAYFSAAFNQIRDTKEDCERGLLINMESKIHFYDSLLIATMERNGIKQIITENTADFAKSGQIKAFDIFGIEKYN